MVFGHKPQRGGKSQPTNSNFPPQDPPPTPAPSKEVIISPPHPKIETKREIIPVTNLVERRVVSVPTNKKKIKPRIVKTSKLTFFLQKIKRFFRLG